MPEPDFTREKRDLKRQAKEMSASIFHSTPTPVQVDMEAGDNGVARYVCSVCGEELVFNPPKSFGDFGRAAVRFEGKHRETCAS